MADAEPKSYGDLRLGYSEELCNALERYFPFNRLTEPRDSRAQLEILLGSSTTDGDQDWVQRHREYKLKIISNYRPLHKELYTMQVADFLVPSFLNSINKNTKRGFKKIITERSPGVLTFQMMQPRFCEMLLAEVKEFEKWVHQTGFSITHPNSMNKFGVVLDDFGLGPMLKKLMDDFVKPIASAFFSEIGGSTLDSHHGFVVEYGVGKDVELGLHVDDSEITLNVGLCEQFSGGELFFRGVRCDEHVLSKIQPEDVLDYSHQIPGQAVIHSGRHRHGDKATTTGHRCNLLLWCRSSEFRQLKQHQTKFPEWCAECQRENS